MGDIVSPAATEALISTTEPSYITIEDVMKLDLRVGTVTEQSLHPKADKLLVLKVDIGEAQPRTIVAGIRSHYENDSLVNKQIIIVANLKPREMRGIVSEGMLFAASTSNKAQLSLLTTDKLIPRGVKVG